MGAALVTALVASACAGEPGSQGARGEQGEAGAGGEQGPPGPLHAAPRIHAIAPESGSYANIVILTGAHFSTTAAENLVYFDGEEAEVISASETTLVVRPWGAYVNEPRGMSVTVLTNNQTSNHHSWTAVPSGSRLPVEAPFVLRASGMALSLDGETLYVGDGYNGVLAVDVDSGRVTWLRRPGEGVNSVGGLAVHPSTGEVYVVDVVEGRGRIAALAPDPEERGVRSFTQLITALAEPRALTFDDSNGDLYVLLGQEAPYSIGRLSADGAWSPSWGTLPVNPLTSVEAHDLTVLGTHLYVSAGTEGIYRFDLATGGSAPTRLAGSNGADVLRGILADPASATLLVTTADGVKRFTTTEPVTRTDYATMPLYNAAGVHGLARDGDAIHILDGTSLWTSDGEDITALTAPNPILGLFSPVFLDGALYFISHSGDTDCAERDSLVMRVLPGEALEPVTTALCSITLDKAPDGRLVGVHGTEGVVRAIDPVTGTVSDIVDLSESFDWLHAATVVDEYVYFTGAAPGGGTPNVGRVRLDGTGLESAWIPGGSFLKARPLGSGLAVVALGTSSPAYIADPDETPTLLLGPAQSAGIGLELAHEGDSLFVATINGDVFEVLPNGGASWSVRHHVVGDGLPTYGMTHGSYGDLWALTFQGIVRITP